MKVDRALLLAVMAAEDDSPWAESLKALATEVTRLQAQNARYEAKINRWMPIVAASQESDELPDGWTWREPWKFSAEGPDGVVCKPDDRWPWCSEAPKAVMQVVGQRSCTMRTSIEANQIAQPLAARCRVRDTEEGMWPEPCQEILRWTDDGEWQLHYFGGQHDDCWEEDHLWLPAPPPPSDD